MSELALYRKYRSRDFSEVIGQDHIVSTLTAAIAAGRLSHAYLFTGPRGVGKTSVARLLARSLNCTGVNKPCGKCANCSAEIGSHMDLIEIDAASNRSIDEVRDLREKISLAPSMGKYKVYIIDEVHMLTKEAFNALLKTLEEPPAHAVFILATTEAHKLPETVISRTQRFNFHPITEEYLVARLRHIAKAEKIDIEDEALRLIAVASRGGFRDAIGMMDQLASSGASPITAISVRSILGWGDTEAIASFSLALATGQGVAALEVLDVLLSQGSQVSTIITQLIEYWRQVMLAAAGTRPAEGTMASITEKLNIAQIVAVIERLVSISKSPMPNLLLEALAIRAAASAEPTNVEAIAVAMQPAELKAKSILPKAENQVPSAETLSVKPSALSQPDEVGGELSQELWPKALSAIKEHNNSLYALLRSCQVALDDGQVLVHCRFSFHRDRLEEPKNRQVIEKSLERVYGRRVGLLTQIDATPASEPVDPSSEVFSSALAILGGEVVNE